MSVRKFAAQAKSRNRPLHDESRPEGGGRRDSGQHQAAASSRARQVSAFGLTCNPNLLAWLDFGISGSLDGVDLKPKMSLASFRLVNCDT